MSDERTVEILPGDAPTRVDRLLAERFPDLTRSAIQSLVRAGLVRVNGETVKPSHVPAPGDVVALRLPPSVEPAPRAQEMALDIVYEDEALLVLNKPAGLVVHPSLGHTAGTLVNALLAHRPSLAGVGADPARPGIVHRLDRDTSGLLVVAGTNEARRALVAAFKGRRVSKTYLALLVGQVSPDRGAIDAPIGRDPNHRQRLAVVREGGRPARTEYRAVEYLPDYTLVEADLLTGRTHQLRVHFSALGYPVAGDRTYGRRKQPAGLARQFLHAWRLRFAHPVTGEELTFEADLPEDLAAFLERARRAP